MRIRSQLEISLLVSLFAVMFVLFASIGCAAMLEKQEKIGMLRRISQAQRVSQHDPLANAVVPREPRRVCVTRMGESEQCATCGNGVCEPHEGCVVTATIKDSVTGQWNVSPDCILDLQCPQDCRGNQDVSASSDTSAWKTYRSESLGYGFSYPSQGMIQEDYGEQKVTLLYLPVANGQFINVVFRANKVSNPSLEQLVAKTIDMLKPSVAHEEVLLGGVPAVRAAQKIVGPETMTSYLNYLVFVRGSFEYQVTATSSTEIAGQGKALLDQVLSTFTFILK